MTSSGSIDASRRSDFWLATTSTFFFFLAVSAFALMPRHLVRLGATDTEVGWIMGSTQVATAVFMPLVGLVLGRLSPRSLMIRGTVLFAAACTGLSWAEGLSWVFPAARIAQGLAFALFFVSAGALVVTVVPEAARARGIALWGTGVLVTQAVAPLGGEWVVAAWGFRELYLGAALCCAAAMLAALPISAAAPPAGLPTSLWALLGRRRVALGLLALFGISVGFGAAFSFLAAFAEREGLGPVSPFFAAYTVTAILVRIAGGSLADRVDRRLVIVPSMLIGCGAIAALALVGPGWLHLSIAGGVYGLASGFANPTLMAFVVDQVEPADAPRAVSLDNWSFTLGMLVGAFAFGPAAGVIGMRGAFVVAAGPGLVGALLLAAWAPTRGGGRSEGRSPANASLR
jgi:MFS family permease